MADNIFDQFDGPAAQAAPTGKVEGPQPNVFDQFDAAPPPAPAAPVAAQPAPTPQPQPSAQPAPAGVAPQQDIKAQLGTNPAAGDYGTPGPVGGTIQDQVQQAQQPQANPLGQAESQEHTEKVQQATQPPNLNENAIPQTVSPNPPPPPVPPAPSQAQIDQDMGLTSAAMANQQFTPQTMQGQTPAKALASGQPPEETGVAGVQTGLTYDRNTFQGKAIEGTRNALQSVGDAIGAGSSLRTGYEQLASIGQRLTPRMSDAVAFVHGLFGRFGTNAARLLGQGIDMANGPGPLSVKDAREEALQNGDLKTYHQLAGVSDEQYSKMVLQAKDLAPELNKLNQAIQQNRAQMGGGLLKESADQTRDITDDWARAHGVDPAKLKLLGTGFTPEALFEMGGEQGPFLAVTGAGGKITAAGAVKALQWLNPELMMAAAQGVPQAVRTVQMTTSIVANTTTISLQSAYMASASGAEVYHQISTTPFDQLKEESPEFAQAVAEGADPQKTREDLAMRAERRAQYSTLIATAVGSALGPLGNKALAGALPKTAGIVSSAASNAAMQAGSKVGQNYAEQVVNPHQSLYQGVSGEALGGAVIGGAFGLGHGEPSAPKAEGKTEPKAKPQQASPIDDKAREAISDYLQNPGDSDASTNIAKLYRWAQLDGGRSAPEVASAATHLRDHGELPDEIEERVGKDYNDDGSLNAAAMASDLKANPDKVILHANVDEATKPAVISALRTEGVNPYTTEGGDVAVIGAKEDMDALSNRLGDQFQGTSFNVTENHHGVEGEGGPAPEVGEPSQGPEVGDETGEGSGAENGPERAADEVGAARQVETPRSQPVIDRLAEEGVKAPVTGEGRVTVEPGNEKAIDIAAHDAAESSENERKVPTPAQKERGNYPKGKILFASEKGDIPVNIESPAGSIRKSMPGQPKWSRKLTEHYGYIPGTYSADGEPVDVIVGRKAHDDSLPVFVMHQTDKAGKFDEHKVVMGARTEREARDMYLKQYPQNLHESLLQGTPKMARFSREQFVDWMKSGNHDVPINPMSKRPMLALRTSGRMDVHFADDVPYDKLDQIADTANAKFGTNLQVAAEGKGYRITGDVPKAKAPAIHRSLQRIEGHEQTNFNGHDVHEILGRRSQESVRPAALGAPEGRGGSDLRGRSDAGKPEETVRNRPELGRSGEGNRAASAEKAPPPPRWLKRVKSEAPVYAKGKGAHPVSVVGVHYSKVPELKELDTSMAGTGSAGAERRRYGMGRPQSDDQHRMYFYVRQSNDLPEKEPVVSGTHAYEAQLNNLYDLRSDPEGIIDRLEGEGRANADSVEEAIREAGYDGFVHPGIANDTPVAQMLGPHKVPVKSASEARFSVPAAKVEAKPEVTHPDTIEGRFFQKIGIDKDSNITDRAAFDKAIETYKTLPDTFGGRVISADAARELSDDYLADRTLSGEVHEPSSAFAKAYYKEMLDKPHGENPMVVFMAGGTGAGKTTAIRALEGESARLNEPMPDIIYDTNTSNTKSAVKKITQALASGRDARITYVYRDPVDAFVNGAVKRALNQQAKYGTGRTVPMNAHVQTHIGSLEAFKNLRTIYEDNPKVDFKLVINDNREPIHDVNLDSVDSLTQSRENLGKELSRRLDELRDNGAISEDLYNGFRKVSPDDPPLEGQAERSEGGERGAGAEREGVRAARGEANPEPAQVQERTPEELQAHVSKLQSHVDGLREEWKGAPETHVVATVADLPAHIAGHIEAALGGAGGVEGLYYGGKVYLVGEALRDPAHAEFVLAHETLGHYGLRATFGDRLDNLLNDIHDSIKDSPEFKEIERRYAGTYDDLPARFRANALTEEFLSDRAALQQKPKLLAKVVAWFRNWARQQGLVSRWTDNDILNLLDGAAANVREGRASAHGWPGETATHDPDLSTRQSYSGAAGEGTLTHNLDGSRSVELGDLKANVSRVMTDEGTGMLVGKLAYKNPADLLAITRLAGEEAKAYVLWPQSARSDLEAAGVPTEVVGKYVQTPASRVQPGEPRFSIRNQPEDEALADRINRVLQVPESSLGPWDRFQHWARKLANFSERRDSFIQAAADQYRAIARDEMSTNPAGTLLDASESAYKMAWMSNNTREVMGAVMKLGVPAYRNGGFEPVAGRKGLMDILMPLYQHETKGMDRMFEFYAMARRGDQLSREVNPDGTSKEKLLTAEDIKAGLALGEKYPVLKKVFDDWQTFNQQVLDLAVERGNMTKEMADLWKQNDYVPFYRVAGDDELNPKGKMPGGLRVSSKRLRGSDRQVEPIIENIIGNTQAVLRKVYKNEALRRTAAIGDLAGTIERMPMKFKPIRMSVGEIEANLEKMGLFVGQQANAKGRAKLQITPAQQEMWTRFFRAQEPMGKDVFTVMENGKPSYYKVNDHLLMESVNSLQKQTQLEGWFRTIFTTPKNFLTHAITLNPAFMLRHLERQVTHTFVQSGENFNPFSHAIDNAKDAYTNSEFMQRMALAGAGGNEYYDIDRMREAMRGMGTHSSILDTGHKLWMAYRKIGFVADQMNRMGIAKAVLKRGGSTAEAAWQAQDLLNFRMHGGSNIMRHLIGAVPFLNARVQGLYRIARGAAGVDQSYKARRSATYAFIVKSAALIAASQFIALRNNGDPRYERLPDEMKANYWHIFIGNYHFAIAKPFEIGALFSTLPDSAVRYAEGLDGSHTFGDNFKRVIETVFRIDPIPGTVKPLLDDWRNKDDLTQRPIVPESVQHLDAAAQVNPYTSPTLTSIAQHMPEFAPDILRSPLRFQHLVQGYTGALGLYTIEAADAATRATGYAPKAPASHFGFPGGGALETVAGSMFGKVDTDPHNRYVNMIYADKQKLDQIAQTIKAYQKAGDIEGLNRYYMQHKTAAQYQAQVMAGYRAMTQYNHEERAIYMDPRMSPEEKRERLDALTKDKTRLLENLAPVLNQADSAL